MGTGFFRRLVRHGVPDAAYALKWLSLVFPDRIL
jgi:hypothetical protein